MERSLYLLCLLLVLSCTCFSYNSQILGKQEAQNIFQNTKGEGTDFASGYSPNNPNGPNPFASGYSPLNDANVQTAIALGYPAPPANPRLRAPIDLGYPAPSTDPNAQKLVTSGYPAPCRAGAVNVEKNGAIAGILAYTLYDGSNVLDNDTPNIKRVTYGYDGTKFTISTPIPIATTVGADGITALPNGNLIIGGEGTQIYQLTPLPGGAKIASVGVAVSDHVSYDSLRNVIWTAGDSPASDLSEVPINPFSNGIVKKLKGDDTRITQIAFDMSHKAYYTSSLFNQGGSFGAIDLDTLTTTRKMSNFPAAHGISFDHFTNTLIMVGTTHIAQIDPATLSVVSDWTAPAGKYPQFQLDQGATDGKGHLWAASNDGNLVFIDFSRTRKVGDPTNYQSIQFLDTKLDDATLLCSLG